MPTNKVVIQLKDGTIAKGQTSDFFPTKAKFHLMVKEGDTKEFNLEDLKALFFVKDYTGDKSYDYQYTDAVTAGGRKIRVIFSDGEEIVGYTQGYSPDRVGFFLAPADLKGNNERIFVVKSATRKIEFV